MACQDGRAATALGSRSSGTGTWTPDADRRRCALKLIRYRSPGGDVRAGSVVDGMVRDAGTSIFDPVPTDQVGPVDDVALACPLPRPGKVVCVGLNYRDHAEESGQPIPETPLLFAKFGSSIIGPGEPIRIPPITEQVDYEAELGVVIGRRARAVSVDDALDHVFGYTCLNDVSARDLQLSDGQWIRGKSLDTFCPVGPWLVSTDEVPDPGSLDIRCVVNDETLQSSNTDQMIFSVPELVSFVSQGITLEPGDLIATGTPPGVGFARTPPVFLRPGDTVRVEIDGIGGLSNPVEAG